MDEWDAIRDMELLPEPWDTALIGYAVSGSGRMSYLPVYDKDLLDRRAGEIGKDYNKILADWSVAEGGPLVIRWTDPAKATQYAEAHNLVRFREGYKEAIVGIGYIQRSAECIIYDYDRLVKIVRTNKYKNDLIGEEFDAEKERNEADFAKRQQEACEQVDNTFCCAVAGNYTPAILKGRDGEHCRTMISSCIRRSY